MVSCGWDKQIIEWDLENKKKIKIYEGHDNSIVHIAYFKNDEHILSIGSDDMIKLWDASSGICMETLQNEVQITTGITLDSRDNLYLGYMDGSISVGICITLKRS